MLESLGQAAYIFTFTLAGIAAVYDFWERTL